MKDREPGGPSPGAGERLGDAVGSCEEVALSEPDGGALGSVSVVPNGVGDTAGETELPGLGVAVAGLGVAVGRGVGRGVGEGVGGGVGAVTTTGLTVTGVGFGPLLLIALKVTVQLPTGSVVEPAQVPWPGFPAVRDRGTERPATVAVTLAAVVDPLLNCTESWKTVAVVPDIGVTVGCWSSVGCGAATALPAVARFSTATASSNPGVTVARTLIGLRTTSHRRYARPRRPQQHDPGAASTIHTRGGRS